MGYDRTRKDGQSSRYRRQAGLRHTRHSSDYCDRLSGQDARPRKTQIQARVHGLYSRRDRAVAVISGATDLFVEGAGEAIHFETVTNALAFGTLHSNPSRHE